MANGKNGGFWKGFVYGLLTPIATTLGVTVIGTVVLAIVGKRKEQLGE